MERSLLLACTALLTLCSLAPAQAQSLAEELQACLQEAHSTRSLTLKGRSGDAPHILTHEGASGRASVCSASYEARYARSPHRLSQEITSYLTQIIVTYREGTTWFYSARVLYHYDDEGHLTEMVNQRSTGPTHRVGSGREEWTNSYRELHSYDDEGRTVETLAQEWKRAANVWVNLRRHLWTYDEAGRVVESISQRWDGAQWVTIDRSLFDYDYDAQGLPVQMTHSSGGVFERTSYTYDFQRNRTEEHHEYWRGDMWVSLDRFAYSYDEEGDVTEEIYQAWRNAAWVNEHRYLYTYDGRGNRLEAISQVAEGEAWVNSQRRLNLYDAEGVLLEGKIYEWDGAEWVEASNHLFTHSFATAVGEAGELPVAYALGANYPNPFNPETVLPFTLPESDHVTIMVYDVLGREVARLADGDYAAGTHTVSWNAEGMATGLYVVRMEAAGKAFTQTVMLMK